jgi:small subunit ribosomal protein S6
MFVMDNRQANRDWDGSLEKLKSMLTKHGAELVRAEKWGERKLAYEMQGRRRGTYMLMYFNATGTAVNQIYRECELSDLMLRALIIKIEKMPPEEMMRNPE